MTKVRMTQQVSGTRDGVSWPEPGMESPDLSDAEARALVQGGAAQPLDYKSDTVLVPPAGVHTPGRTAYGDVNLVEAPVDAVLDPAAATAAYQAALAGDTAKSVPSGSSVQNHDGSAMTAKQIDQALEADRQTAADLGLPSPEDKAPAASSASSTPSAATKSTASSAKTSDAGTTSKTSDTKSK